MNKLTTIYLCKTSQLMNETLNRMVIKYRDIIIYNDGVLVRQSITGDKSIELVNDNEFKEIIKSSKNINVYIKSNKIDNFLDYVGYVKGIIVLQEDVAIPNLRKIPNKKMVEVGYL